MRWVTLLGVCLIGFSPFAATVVGRAAPAQTQHNSARLDIHGDPPASIGTGQIYDRDGQQDILRQFLTKTAQEAADDADVEQPTPAPVRTDHDTSKLSATETSEIARRCAPTAPPSALVAIVRVESSFEPWTIGINGRRPERLRFSTKADAAQSASRLLARGNDIDLGLAQLNSRNLTRLGLTVEDALDPCRNLAAASRVFDEGYARALTARVDNQPILQMAYSVYNSGDVERGWDNGYVHKVEAAALKP